MVDMRTICIRALVYLLFIVVYFGVRVRYLDSDANLISSTLSDATAQKIEQGERLRLREQTEVENAAKAMYLKLRQSGIDEVSNTPESTALRNYRLRNKKRAGKTLADFLFPEVSPEEYDDDEPIAVYADRVESRKNPIPYKYYDLPFCPEPKESNFKHRRRENQNLGSRLEGHDLKVAPFDLRVKQNKACTILCVATMDSDVISWIRNLTIAQYRVQLQLDSLPLLMRYKNCNIAEPGYPLGFQAPASFQEFEATEFNVFNHLKFVVTYHEDPSVFQGTRIVGFDVIPASIQHHHAPTEVLNENSTMETCDGGYVYHPSHCSSLKQTGSEPLEIVYSYEVEWVATELQWADRWDVYYLMRMLIDGV